MFAFNSFHHPMVPNQPAQPQTQYQHYYNPNTQPIGFNCYSAANGMASMNPAVNANFIYNPNMNVGIANNMNMPTLGTANNNNNNSNNNGNSGTQPNGGVASVLDYDLDQMVKFLSWVAFGLVKKSMSPSLAFQKSINSVLSATRLPKSTLLLAINYLSNKMDDDLSSSSAYIHCNEDEIFKILITALILSNKFNDDKTFRNKSWSDATNLPLLEINKLERSWLMDCNYELFKTNSFSMVESCWNTWCIKNIQSIDNNTSTVNNHMVHQQYNHPSNLVAPLTPVSTNPSSPINPSCCYYDNNTIPNQIFENPFQNVTHPENIINSIGNNHQHQSHPSMVISPANDFPYMSNDYLEMPMNTTNNYYNNGNHLQTINPHHLEYENDQVINYDMNNSYNYGLDYIYNGYSNYGCFNGYNYCAATAC
ncbi:hypothetical protein PICMEDRAFT_74728 [Pichia membranifaciens NRRL Y-2026]|uniref:Cyclin N-terminal domain-containing protein n=1 Tax=Pichia membranifaciens NRRL Y-2026 TaxID=763406 RepID=A0A1E3NEH4_9ASCO|nr:hypothetical protein PICMEDRAFT_74728 [Pichia membranifaciens NRRL Y-2026]ODQ44496.1 hypothetical protein PICMEDRAFT_74728 [Pichia membranifaciens NRRL Y-2026]